MPFQYERDDVKQQIVVTLRGAFDRDESLQILQRHRSEDFGDYSVLYDVLELSGEPTTTDMRLFMAEEMAIPTETRGPIAIVATANTKIYAMACTYVVLGRPKLKIEVFRQRGEAEAWLLAQVQIRAS
jgi:hypothetical protein